MNNPLQSKFWSPYLVGVGIGVLSWFAFWSADHPLGITTAEQFLFRDWTVVKIMGIAVVVGAAGIYALLPIDAVSLHIKPLIWLGIVAGGICFGAGMAIFGYCPGTSVAACGQGRRDAMVGVLGMLAGAGLYVALYPQLSNLMKSWGDAGKITLPEWTGTSPWLWIGGLALVAVSAVAYSLRGRSGATQRVPGNAPQRQSPA